MRYFAVNLIPKKKSDFIFILPRVILFLLITVDPIYSEADLTVVFFAFLKLLAILVFLTISVAATVMAYLKRRFTFNTWHRVLLYVAWPAVSIFLDFTFLASFDRIGILWTYSIWVLIDLLLLLGFLKGIGAILQDDKDQEQATKNRETEP